MTDANSNSMYNLICNIDHEFFDIVDNETRRKILRLIACEHNYGNRIANILDLSTPAIHRHLKYLSGQNPGEISLIDVYRTTNVSHSGYKGGEAQLYKINKKVGMFYHVFPNFVHSHILEDKENDESVLGDQLPEKHSHLEPRDTDEELGDEEYTDLLMTLKEISDMPKEDKKETVNNLGHEKVYAVFKHIYERLQIQNQKIREMEEELLDMMSIKNDFMGILDNILQAQQDLGYEERVILRAVTCLGKECSSDLSHLMNMNDIMIDAYVNNLRNKNWLK